METEIKKGKVDVSKEHFLLYFNEIRSKPYAKISKNGDGFIIEITNIFRSYGMELAKLEIKRYLLESKENNPWEYAKYRCRTISNVYADIRWAYCEGEKSND